MQSDIIVVGGGIVGLATALKFSRLTRQRVVVIEKESTPAYHQTGRNSGVLHTGIYYSPGSLKAITCRTGKKAMEEFCAVEKLPIKICGKVIVAVTEDELPSLEKIFARGLANNVKCKIIDQHRLRELEPHAAGIKAIHVPEAGIIDYGQVCHRIVHRLHEEGNVVVFDAKVTGIKNLPDCVVAETTVGDYTAKKLVNCAGLHSDRVAKLAGVNPGCQIVPFRGEYYRVKESANHLCRNLIYPVPDTKFPFLGVHFTRMIDNSVECGPNAVLAFGRESYRFFDINVKDLYETLTYRGFLTMGLRHWKMGLGEMWRSLNKKAFVRALQRLVPDIRAEDLEVAPSGIRAQAVASNGALVDDFLIAESDRVINVCNAPSPAATASFAIAESIVSRVAGTW